MESAKTLLFVIFAFLSFLLYQEWQEDHKPAVIEKAAIETSLATFQDNTPIETHSIKENTNVDISAQIPTEIEKTGLVQKIEKNIQPIIVTTDTLKVILSPVGGNLVSAQLINYKETLDESSQPINILENRNGRVFIALSGLYGKGAPDHDKNVATYSSVQSNYVLASDEEKLLVDLTWVNQNGVEYIKRFTFYSGEYVLDVEYIVNNKSNQKIANRMFTAIKRDTEAVEGAEQTGLGMRSYLGPAFSTEEEKYQKYEFDDLLEEDLNQNTKNGWVAILQHYFVTAWIPISNTNNVIDTTYEKRGNTDLAQIRITQDWQWINPLQIKTFSSKLYVGPKVQSKLEETAEGLDLTVDYGILWWIGQPIFHLLIFFQGFVINWGLAIILVTISIKTLLYPLARAQYRSFAKMRLLQPKMATMKEQYGDDKQKMSMKMMELYKKEKVNPLGGCFPLLIQMPVFISLYWVLMESVELRHAPFILWIEDMSVMDPYYVMPLLMGGSMYLMQKMQPVSPTMDPMQQKMMQMMPVFMTVFFVFFPAGLVLYWLMNNLISIAQQLYITKKFNAEIEAKKK